MNKRIVNSKNRKTIYDEAEKLYVYDLLAIEETAQKVQVSPRTICYWKESGEWDVKRKAFIKSKQAFHKDLYELARKLMEGILVDLENNTEISQTRSALFTKMLPLIVKIKEYEDVVNNNQEKQTKKGHISPELIRTIEEEILGIKHRDE